MLRFHKVNKALMLMLVLVFLVSCASNPAKIGEGALVHKDLYQAPVLGNTWARFSPVGGGDAIFFRCPGDHVVMVSYFKIAGRWNYSEMGAEDYAKRLYQNTYYSGWKKGFLYRGGSSPLYDRDFKRLVGGPVIFDEDKGLELVYESKSNEGFCGNDNVDIKVMDVLFEEKQLHLWCSNCTRFVLFRYMSAEDMFEYGLDEFKKMVGQFHWLYE
jgi:hypothetical protein